MDAFRNEDFSHDAARQGAIDTLHREGCSCVILCGGREYLFRQRGVRDLHDLLRGRPELRQKIKHRPAKSREVFFI